MNEIKTDVVSIGCPDTNHNQMIEITDLTQVGETIFNPTFLTKPGVVNTIPIKFKQIGDYKYTPEIAKNGDACVDLRTRVDISIAPNETKLIPLGVAIALPKGWELQIRPRSGLSLKTELIAKNTIGTIDSGYRGELGFVAKNLGSKYISFKQGDRVCQAALKPIYIPDFNLVDDLDETDRGESGFNSTGLK